MGNTFKMQNSCGIAYVHTHTHSLTHTVYLHTHTKQQPRACQRWRRIVQSQTRTFPGGFEAVIDVYPLDVVGERGVWQ